MCQHCYENHWNQVIQEATVVLNRQRRLDMLSAVPLDRRHGKDFEAAFGENLDDVQLLRPPMKGSALDVKTMLGKPHPPLQSARPFDSELFDSGESLQLLCPQGHLIQKKKKLKPWQDFTSGNKPCSECQETINREEFRWRCEYHCNCNVCEECYRSHWSEILAIVHKTTDEQKCWQLLSAIPLHLRDGEEFRAAKARVNRRAMRQAYREPTEDTPMEQKAALTAYGTEAGPKELKGRIQGALQLADRVVDNRPSLQIGFWGFLAVLAEYEIFSRTSRLQGGDNTDFPASLPHPLLIACISTAIGSGFLQILLLALRIFRRKFGELPPAPAPPPELWPAIQHLRQLHLEAANGRTSPRRRGRARRRALEAPQQPPPLQPQMLHVYLFLGIFLGLETGITVTLWYHGAHRATLGLHPLALLLVGLLVGAESRKDHRLLLSMMLASLSGFLMFPAWNASNIDAEIHGLLFAMLGQFLTLARWIFTDNVLPSFESPASDRFSAAIVLAANIAVAAATALLELTTVLDFPGYFALLEVEPLPFIWTVGILGLCVAVKLVASLNLARVASFPFLGILPMISAVPGLHLSQPDAATMTEILGVLLCVASLACFLRARQRRSELPPEPKDDYQPLEDGPEDL